LEDIARLLEKKGFRLVNLDTVLIAQAPRLGPHIASMQTRLAEVLKVSRADVNVKVKSGEGLDFWEW
ncbi:2-C-methyl-D-erythritol 2,4-cyclodiphosphate synthase, partial [Acidobacteriia bacterium AH_259_A11_L15]|nr:2-C-methyl-D-erythritol 2,4-cyclodiphosphate synthase [Acidobacteriia bacterium AH_259_A11_L15]